MNQVCNLQETNQLQKYVLKGASLDSKRALVRAQKGTYWKLIKA